MQTAIKSYAAAAAFHPQPSARAAFREKDPFPVFSGGIGEDIEQFKAVEEFLSAGACDARDLLTPEEQAICDMATD